MKNRFYIGLTVGGLLMSLIVAAAPQQLQAAPARANDYPIVLVHAWLAWGRGQMLGFNVWGGNMCDLQKEMCKAGYTTCTASLGPFSSTWDRACELYAQIKGGTVDYGLAHSIKHGHARFGRTYATGFCPNWGAVDPSTGKINKVHLMCHCFGGITGRQLIQLLEQGDAEEIAATPCNELSPLFAGKHSWVSSCVTISAPHNGTSELDLPGLKQLTRSDMLFQVLALFAPDVDDRLYDFQLDQWGLAHIPGETTKEFVDRVSSAQIWTKGDFSNFDMLPSGVYEFNSRVKAQPDVYYFSLATKTTFTADRYGHQLPTYATANNFMTMAAFMGVYTRKATTSAPYPIDSRWWPNDGAVNTYSMSGPKVGAAPLDTIVNFNGTPQKGVWNFMGTLSNTDHFDVVGINFGWFPFFNPKNWCINMAGILASLPN
jgi:triacylglycerol lipase